MILRDLLDELDATPNDENDERLEFEVKCNSERHDDETFDIEPGARNEYNDKQVIITLS